MSNFIDDVMGTPRKRSKAPSRSPLASPSALDRKKSPDLFHTALTVPTQATFASKSEAGPSSTTETRSTVEAAASNKDDSTRSELPPSEIPLPAELPPVQQEAQVEPVNEPVKVPVTDKSVLVSEGGPPSALNILPPMPVLHNLPALLIGISGCTGSGKTMLSHLLCMVLPPTTQRFVLHQDDFFVPKHLLVPSKDGEMDADCRDAIDFETLIRVLGYVKKEGKLPPSFHTKQSVTYEQGHAGTLASKDVLNEARNTLAKAAILEDGRPVCIVDGFLLYHEPRIRELLDVKLFLRTKKETAKGRRFERPDYMRERPQEEFWRTQTYFDRVVWPNYTEEHAPLFENGDVEGTHLPKVCDYLEISMQPQLGMSIEDTLRWAASTIAERHQSSGFGRSRSLDPEEVLRDKYKLCDCGSGWIGKFRRVLLDIV